MCIYVDMHEEFLLNVFKNPKVSKSGSVSLLPSEYLECKSFNELEGKLCIGTRSPVETDYFLQGYAFITFYSFLFVF